MNSKRMVMGLAAILLGVGVCIAVEQAPVKPVTVKDAYPGLTSGALRSARLSSLPEGVLLRSGELELTQKDVDADVAKSPQSLRPELKNNGFFVLENLAIEDLLVAEGTAWAKQNGREISADKDELLKAYFTDLLAKLAVTDAEAKAFFDANKALMGDATFDQAKEDVKSFLLDQKHQQAVNEHIASISERVVVEVNEAWVAKQYPLAMNNPVDKARQSGKPTMADFSGARCKPCEMQAPILEAIKKQYAGKMNIVLVSMDKEPVLAARYGIEVMPVQVFFDKSGDEVFRHEGLFPKEQIVAQLAKMGIK